MFSYISCDCAFDCVDFDCVDWNCNNLEETNFLQTSRLVFDPNKWVSCRDDWTQLSEIDDNDYDDNASFHECDDSQHAHYASKNPIGIPFQEW